MDSNDIDRERGINIRAKNCAIESCARAITSRRYSRHADYRPTLSGYCRWWTCVLLLRRLCPQADAADTVRHVGKALAAGA